TIYANDTSSKNWGLFGKVIGSSSKNAEIKNLIVEGKITCLNSSSSSVGGIIGFANYVNLSKLANYVNIVANGKYTNVGGISGKILEDNSTVSECFNYGNLSGEYHIGGITGDGDDITATNVFNMGNIL